MNEIKRQKLIEELKEKSTKVIREIQDYAKTQDIGGNSETPEFLQETLDKLNLDENGKTKSPQS